MFLKYYKKWIKFLGLFQAFNFLWSIFVEQYFGGSENVPILGIIFLFSPGAIMIILFIIKRLFYNNFDI